MTQRSWEATVMGDLKATCHFWTISHLIGFLLTCSSTQKLAPCAIANKTLKTRQDFRRFTTLMILFYHLVYVCYCGGQGLGHPEAVTVLTSESALLRAERERHPYSTIVLIHAQWAVRLQPLASRFQQPKKSTKTY